MMHEDELRIYCEKYAYKILDIYTTTGEVRSHLRAKVRTSANKIHYLYYDPSRKRRSLTQQKKDWKLYQQGKIPPTPKARRWRDTTLERQNSRTKTI